MSNKDTEVLDRIVDLLAGGASLDYHHYCTLEFNALADAYEVTDLIKMDNLGPEMAISHHYEIEDALTVFGAIIKVVDEDNEAKRIEREKRMLGRGEIPF